MGVCSVAGIDSEHCTSSDKKTFGRLWKGMCGAHYQRWKQWGDPLGGTAHGVAAKYFYETVMVESPDCKIWPYGKANDYGYIYADGKQLRVHVLACEAWNGPAPEGTEACHGPCHDPSCYNGAHLYWGTRQQNADDRRRDGTHIQGSMQWRAKLTEEDIPIIRARAAAGESQRLIGIEYGVAQSAISKIIRGIAWKHVP